MLEIGQPSPAVSLPTDTGHFSLSDYSGKNVVIFFFPKADTSGCTKEAIAFLNYKQNLMPQTQSSLAFQKTHHKSKGNSGTNII